MLRDFITKHNWVTASNYMITFFPDKTDDGGVM